MAVVHPTGEGLGLNSCEVGDRPTESERLILITKKRFARATALVSAGLLAVGLSACGSSDNKSADSESGDAASSDAAAPEEVVVVGYSQLGAESGWRTANTESVKENLTPENGFDMTFVDAQQKQENQIKALRDFVAQDVDVIAFPPSSRPVGTKSCRKSKTRAFPSSLLTAALTPQWKTLTSPTLVPTCTPKVRRQANG